MLFKHLRAKWAKRRRRAFRRTLLDGDRVPLVRLGTDYGGWYVPASALMSGGVAICVGAGEDISFDVALNAGYGMNVVTVDPTPRAGRHVEALLEAAATGGSLSINRSETECYDLTEFDPARFRFVDQGLAEEDGVMRFYAPADAASVSHSMVNLHNTGTFFEAECRTLASLCREIGVVSVALLKIDVEGAEYRIIDNLTSDRLFPPILLVEFDEGDRDERKGWQRRIASAVSRLKACGYQAVHLDKWNVTFVRPRDHEGSARAIG
jgi:FkbM family methyltransferase